MRCERYYDLSVNELLQPKGQNFGQSRGTRFHNLLYLFYKAKIHKKPFEKCCSDSLRYLRILGKYLEAREYMLTARKFAEYCAYYRSENIQPLAVEKGFSKILFENKDYLFIYEGRIDFIGKFMNDSSRYWVDHKTESRKEDLNPNSFQFLGYSWAVGTTNGLINYIGFQDTKGPAEAFRRTIITHRRELLEEWREQAIHIYFRIANLHRHGYYIKNRTQCKPYQCNPCMYADICDQTNPRKISAIIQEGFVRRKTPWKAWD